MTYGRLKGLPFFCCDKLVTLLLSIFGQNDDRITLPLIGRVYATHRRHNRRMFHHL